MIAMPYSSRGVDAWRNDKNHISDIKCLFFDLVYQCFDSGPWIAIDYLQSKMRQDSVFACHRNNICSNRSGYQIEIRNEIVNRFIAIFAKRLDQFESDAAATQFIIRVIT